MSIWISCKEELPESDTTVLVYAKTGNEPVWPGYHDGEDWIDASGVIFNQGAVTHWMQFPEPPEV